MIIVEGMDNTGKTTLVEELQQLYPKLTYRPSIGNKHDLNQIKEQAYEEAYTPMPLVLADRSRIISEFIYNPILNARPIAYPWGQYMDLVKSFVRGHHLVIFCHRPLHELMKTFDSREQLAGVKENAAKIFKAYEEVEGMFRFLFRVSNSGSEVHDYDYADGVSHTLAVTKTKRYIEDEEAIG